MCYNCGCGLPKDDMGVGDALGEENGQSITDNTFKELSKKWNVTELEAKNLTRELLEGKITDRGKEVFLENLYEEAGKSQGMTTEEAKEETLKLLTEVLS